MKSTSRQRLLVLTILGGAVSGCAVGPDFKSPDAPNTDRYTTQPLPEKTVATDVAGGEAQAFVIGKQLPAQWWQLFGSEKLNQLVTQAFANSPNTAAARAALRQAEENLNAARGSYFPSVDANGLAQRQNSVSSNPSVAGVSSRPFTLYHASVSVAYTLDIFGGVRRAVESQAAALDSQRYELQATYLTLAANVVTASVAEASLRDQLAATNDILTALEKQLSITEKRYELGSAAYPEVLTARTNLAGVRATLPPLEKQLGAVQTQLAVYLGQLPSETVASNFDIAELKLPEELPLSLPSELVRQRPDVRAAEARLHQASAQIGVATANLLPQLSISGSYGSQALEARQLFDSSTWNIGANLTQPLFHGGELTARRRAAIAAYDESAANYQQTVLGAFQNVADALTAVQSDAKTLHALNDALVSAQKSFELTEKQHELGGVSYLNLLIAQRQYQQARIEYSRALATRYQDTAALFQALGGNWDGSALAATAAPSSTSSTLQPATTTQP